MLIVRIHGGLGNQMYEYALVYALKKRYPKQTIKLDTSDYYRFAAHTGFSLKKYFDIDEEIATDKEIRKVYPGVIYSERYVKLPIVARTIYDKIAYWKTKSIKYQMIMKQNVITDFRHNIYNDAVFQIDEDRDYYFKGYWQNLLYFDQYRDELRKIFTPIKEIPQTQLGHVLKENTVSVHVRRGDYVGSTLDLCGENYYRAAIQQIEKSVYSPQYVFFTDDSKFVEEKFQWIENKTVIANSPADCDVDMRLMSLCRHHIIANSSFSFWAAYLADSDGLVIAPQKWMRVECGYCGINMPQNWVIIENG